MNPNREKAEKAKKEKVKRSPEELEKDYRKQVAHCVDRIGMWSGKLEKMVHSKRHSLTSEQTDKVKTAVALIYNQLEQSMTPKATEEAKGFSL